MIILLLAASIAAAETPATAEARALVSTWAEYGDEANPDRSQGWWQGFEDPGLQQVLKAGLNDNPDLRAAEARVQLARAGTWQSVANLLPNIYFELASQKAPTDAMGLSPMTANMPDYGELFESLGAMLADITAATGGDPSTLPDFSTDSGSDTPDTYTQSSAMLKGSLAVDIFGRQTMGAIAANKTAQATAASRDALTQSLATQIGSAWYDLVAARQQAQIVERQVLAGKEMLEIIELRYERGEGSALDVFQQRQQLASTEILLPKVRLASKQAHQRLSIALGQAPDAELPQSDALPAVPPAPAIGSSDRLVTDRADVQAAIDTLDSARIQRGAAIAGLAPTVTLTGQYGRQYLTLDETEHVDSWGLGAAASVPLFGGGRTHAGIKAAKANRDIAQMGLRSQILSAIQQVESAIANEDASAESLQAAERQQLAATQAYTESRARYLEGLLPYINVLASQAAHQAAQLGLLDAQRSRIQARIQLYGALGGTWNRSLENTP
jgi:multidrug efflux system outer membrane protein